MDYLAVARSAIVSAKLLFMLFHFLFLFDVLTFLTLALSLSLSFSPWCQNWQTSGAYFTAVLYVEHWCEENFNSLTLGPPDFSHVEIVSSYVHLIVGHQLSFVRVSYLLTLPLRSLSISKVMIFAMKLSYILKAYFLWCCSCRDTLKYFYLQWHK